MTVKKKALDKTLEKGENAGKQHFLLFSQCFLLYHKRKSSYQKFSICWLQMLAILSGPQFCGLVERYTALCPEVTLLPSPSRREILFENIVRKEENTGNQHFLLFPQCFLLFPKQILVFASHLFCLLQMLSIWLSPKFCRLVKN